MALRGHEYLQTFFEKCSSLLKPSGKCWFKRLPSPMGVMKSTAAASTLSKSTFSWRLLTFLYQWWPNILRPAPTFKSFKKLTILVCALRSHIERLERCLSKTAGKNCSLWAIQKSSSVFWPSTCYCEGAFKERADQYSPFSRKKTSLLWSERWNGFGLLISFCSLKRLVCSAFFTAQAPFVTPLLVIIHFLLSPTRHSDL